MKLFTEIIIGREKCRAQHSEPVFAGSAASPQSSKLGLVAALAEADALRPPSGRAAKLDVIGGPRHPALQRHVMRRAKAALAPPVCAAAAAAAPNTCAADVPVPGPAHGWAARCGRGRSLRHLVVLQRVPWAKASALQSAPDTSLASFS